MSFKIHVVRICSEANSNPCAWLKYYGNLCKMLNDHLDRNEKKYRLVLDILETERKEVQQTFYPCHILENLAHHRYSVSVDCKGVEQTRVRLAILNILSKSSKTLNQQSGNS